MGKVISRWAAGSKWKRRRDLVLSNIIANNTFIGGATQNGGGIDITSGGGPVILANNTIVGNAVNGVHADFGITLVNNIIMTHPVGVSAGATTNTSYNIYFGNTTNTQGFLTQRDRPDGESTTHRKLSSQRRIAGD